MKKVLYSFIFIVLSLLTLQAESMVVATYNLRNANAGDSTSGNGWGNVVLISRSWCNSTDLTSSVHKKGNTINCKI